MSRRRQANPQVPVFPGPESWVKPADFRERWSSNRDGVDGKSVRGQESCQLRISQRHRDNTSSFLSSWTNHHTPTMENRRLRMLLRHLDVAREHVRKQEIIRVEEIDEFSPGEWPTGVTGRRGTGVVLTMESHSLAVPGSDGGRVICGAIVDHHHLDPGMSLAQATVDRTGQETPLVPARDYHADKRRPHDHSSMPGYSMTP
jgi:hypothetical protein